MTCCNQECTQGHNCPVRATRDAGACTPEPEDQQFKDDMVAFVILMVLAYTVICGWLGYLWGTHGAAIETFLWSLAARLA